MTLPPPEPSGSLTFWEGGDMSEVGIIEVQGPGWAISYDARAAPEYVLVTLRGESARARTERLVELITADRSRIELPTGQLCPFILFTLENPPPSAAVMRSEYDLLDEFIPQVSCLILVLEPERQEDPK